MADKTTQDKEVESTVEETPVTKTAELEDETSNETHEALGNGSVNEKNGNDKEAEEDVVEEENGVAQEEKVCSIKRKSVGGDATDGKITTVDGATPEKKAKIDDGAAEVTTAEANGDVAEVAA